MTSVRMRARRLWKWLNSPKKSNPKTDIYRVGDNDRPPAYRRDGLGTGTSPGSRDTL